LTETFPQANSIKFPLASTYSFYLKATIESLVLRHKELRIFFNKVDFDKVIYISQLPGKEIIDFNLLFWGNVESLFSRLTPLICKKQGIPFERIVVPSDDKDVAAKKPFIKRLLNIQGIKEFISSKKILKILCNDFAIIRACTRTPKNNYPEKSTKTSILFLEQNSYIRKMMVEAIKAGYKVYYQFGNSIIRQYCGFHLTKCRINNKEKIKPPLDSEMILQRLKKNTNLINWLNRACEADTESLILPRLLHFIEITSPEVISLTNEYAKIYDSLGIQFVFLAHTSTPAEHAAIVACKYLKKIKVGYINHGDDVFDTQEFVDDHVSPYDIFVVSNDEVAEYLKDKKTKGKFNTDILQAPIRYTILPPKKSLKSKTKKDKPIIIFVPTMYQWDNTFWATLWPDTWYFHWHKKLLDFFASRTDFEFIWKALPASSGTYDPILDIIKEKKYSNVRYETSPFPSWTPVADRVLSDYPSTALYEAVFASLPVMSLYFAPFCRVRKTAVEIFGKSLQPFSNFNEGIQRISAFLDADASQFIANIPHSTQSFINLLGSIYEPR